MIDIKIPPDNAALMRMIKSDTVDLSDEKDQISVSQSFINDQRKAYIEFDYEFKKFLSNFVKQQNKKDKQKRKFKNAFFWMIMFSFIAMLIMPAILVYLLSDAMDASIITAILASMVELIVAIKILPQIIADYLFNKEEDKDMIGIIESMQNYNEKKHEYIDKQK